MVAKEKVLNVEISTLTPADLGAIDDLMKGNGQTLGFLPANALSEYLRKGTVFGAKTRSGRLMGTCYTHRARAASGSFISASLKTSEGPGSPAAFSTNSRVLRLLRLPLRSIAAGTSPLIICGPS